MFDTSKIDQIKCEGYIIENFKDKALFANFSFQIMRMKLNTAKSNSPDVQTQKEDDSPNIAFLNMSINNNVNWQKTSACPTSLTLRMKVEWTQYCRNVEHYLSVLKKWCL